AARPGRDKGGGQRAGEGLGLVVARRAGKLHRSRDDLVEPPDDEPLLRDQQHAFPVGFENVARRRLEPAEPAAFADRALGRVAQIVEIGAGVFGQQLDPDIALGDPLAHGRHPRKLAIRRSPAAWLFSGWNWVPNRLSRPIAAVIAPPYCAVAIRSRAEAGRSS